MLSRVPEPLVNTAHIQKINDWKTWRHVCSGVHSRPKWGVRVMSGLGAISEMPVQGIALESARPSAPPRGICPSGKSGDHFFNAASLARPGSFRNRINVNCNLLKRFNLIWAVQSLGAEIFHFYLSSIGGFFCTVPARQRGVSRSSRTLGRNAMDAKAPKDERR